MINADRIVPVMATDLITLYGVILKMDSNNSSLAKLNANGIGNFTVTSGSAPLLATEPVKTLTFADTVSAATVYFVPDYDYEKITGSTGDVDADGNTLYKAVLSSGTVTITKVGL